MSHEPEPNAVQFYDEQGIVMVTVNLDRDEELDFNKIGAVIAERANVSFCCNMDCKRLRPKTIERKIIKKPLTCERCGQKYKCLVALSQSPLGDFVLPDLTEAELSNWKLLSSSPAYVIRLQTKLFDRDMLTLRTNCLCQYARRRTAPSDYYFDNIKGRYVRKKRF